MKTIRIIRLRRKYFSCFHVRDSSNRAGTKLEYLCDWDYDGYRKWINKTIRELDRESIMPISNELKRLNIRYE